MSLRRLGCCLAVPLLSLICSACACTGLLYINMQTDQFVVRGESMQPTFENNDIVFVTHYVGAYSEPQRGDVIVFHSEDEQNRDFIKRIIGIPGDHIEMNRGIIYINDVQLDEPYIEEVCLWRRCRNRDWYIAENQYFVLGDNRNDSQDSVEFGPIRRDQIIGKALFRYNNIWDWGVLVNPDYDPALN